MAGYKQGYKRTMYNLQPLPVANGSMNSPPPPPVPKKLRKSSKKVSIAPSDPSFDAGISSSKYTKSSTKVGSAEHADANNERGYFTSAAAHKRWEMHMLQQQQQQQQQQYQQHLLYQQQQQQQQMHLHQQQQEAINSILQQPLPPSSPQISSTAAAQSTMVETEPYSPHSPKVAPHSAVEEYVPSVYSFSQQTTQLPSQPQEQQQAQQQEYPQLNQHYTQQSMLQAQQQRYPDEQKVTKRASHSQSASSRPIRQTSSKNVAQLSSSGGGGGGGDGLNASTVSNRRSSSGRKRKNQEISVEPTQPVIASSKKAVTTKPVRRATTDVTDAQKMLRLDKRNPDRLSLLINEDVVTSILRFWYVKKRERVDMIRAEIDKLYVDPTLTDTDENEADHETMTAATGDEVLNNEKEKPLYAGTATKSSTHQQGEYDSPDDIVSALSMPNRSISKSSKSSTNAASSVNASATGSKKETTRKAKDARELFQLNPEFDLFDPSTYDEQPFLENEEEPDSEADE